MPVVVDHSLITKSIIHLKIEEVPPPHYEDEVLTATPAAGGAVYAIASVTNVGGQPRIVVAGSILFNISSTFPNNLFYTMAGFSEPLLNECFAIEKINDTTFDLLTPFPSGFVYSGSGAVAIRKTEIEFTAGTPPSTAPGATHFRWVGSKPIRRWCRLPVTDVLHLTAWSSPAGYSASILGGRSVVNVYRKKVLYTTYRTRLATGEWGAASAFVHYISLELDGPLPESGAQHTIKFPAALNLPDYSFLYRVSETRHEAIKHGAWYRPSATRKKGSLSMWVPKYGSQNGNVDFTAIAAAGFSIINDAGAEVFTGGTISLKLARNAADVTVANAPLYYRSAIWTSTPWTITAMNLSGANPVITYSGGVGDPVNGDIIAFDGIVGAQSIGPTGSFCASGGVDGGSLMFFYQVSAVNTGAKTFVPIYQDGTTPITCGSATPYVSGGKIYKVDNSRNWSKVDRWEFDFSSFAPANGYYRIKTSVGVSDRIQFDEAANYKLTKGYFGALFNQLQCIPLDGRFGVTSARRPYAEKKIVKSWMPGSWHGEYGGATTSAAGVTALSPDHLANATWSKGTFLPSTFVGGMNDAGDHDSYAYHISLAMDLMLAYEMLPPAARTMSLNMPTMAELLGSAWTGVSVPDLLKIPLFIVNTYFQLQEVDGMVSANIQPANLGSIDSEAISSSPWAAAAPEIIGCYWFAMGAAKLARCLTLAGVTTWPATYQAAAVSAWNAAEPKFASDATHEAYHATALGKTTWTAPQKTAVIVQMRLGAKLLREIAAATLFRLTGSSTYSTIFEASYNAGTLGIFEGLTAHGCIEYIGASGGNSTIKTGAIAAILTQANNWLGQMDTDAASWRNIKYTSGGGLTYWGTLGLGSTFNPMIPNFLYLAISGGTPQRWRDAMQMGMDFVHGHNQLNMTMATGLGKRPVRGILSNELNATGKVGPFVPIYGAGSMYQANNWMISDRYPYKPIAYNTIPAFVQNFIDNGKQYHELDPPLMFFPPAEQNFEAADHNVQSQEYTVTQNLNSMAVLSAFLHAYDGNTATEQHGGKKRFVMSCY